MEAQNNEVDIWNKNELDTSVPFPSFWISSLSMIPVPKVIKHQTGQYSQGCLSLITLLLVHLYIQQLTNLLTVVKQPIYCTITIP